MERVGAYEAKTHLSRLLEQVEAGATVAITRHGHEVARLVPATAAAEPAETVIADLLDARRGVRRGRTSVRVMIEEGRR